MAKHPQLPKLSDRAQVRRANFIIQTLHEGWCLATENTLECVVAGTHDYGLAVAPDGSYGTLHWTSLARQFTCRHASPGSGEACFGLFEAEFPGPITTLEGLAEPFRKALPVLQDAHRVWLTRPRCAAFKHLSAAVSGDLARDVELLKGSKNTPDEIADLTALYTAIYAILETQSVSPQSLAALKAGLSSTYGSVWQRAGELLIQLSHDIPDAGEALVDCMAHKQASTRLRTVQSIFSVRPKPELSRRILALGLKDKGKAVRNFSGNRIRLLRLREMLPDLEAAIAVERDPKVAYAFKTQRSLLKFGVQVELNDPQQGYRIWVSHPGGTGSSRPIPKSRFNKKSLEEYVARLNGDVELLKDWTMKEVLSSPTE